MKKGKMQKVQLKNKSTFGNEKKNMEVESYLRMGKRGKVREIFSSRIFIDCCFALPSMTKRSRRAEENRRRAASGEGKERHKISNLEPRQGQPGAQTLHSPSVTSFSSTTSASHPPLLAAQPRNVTTHGGSMWRARGTWNETGCVFSLARHSLAPFSTLSTNIH